MEKSFSLDISSHRSMSTSAVSCLSPSLWAVFHCTFQQRHEMMQSIRLVILCSRLSWRLRAWKSSSAPQRCNQSSGAAQLILIKPFIKPNNLCFTWEEGNCTFPQQFEKNLCRGEPSSRGDACVDWHIQMNEQSIERSVVYLFHIITENISNFHHEYCGVPWQALIVLRHPSGEMMVLDGRQALGVRLRDEGGEGG